jgi:amino acid adenylation domain-containing protein/non-ribosomal peptide synthase protein (TIGR01720 family)
VRNLEHPTGEGACPPTGSGPHECLHDWFARVAAAHPDAVATADLTYAQLDARANQLAHTLIARGVGPETLVGLCVGRSPDLLVGILGILKAGGAYVPFDPAHPAERIAFMLADSGVRCVVTQPRFAALFAGADTLDVHAPDAPAHAAHAGATPGNAAYVIYTSGSTGRPKGCVVTHANVTRLMTQTEKWFGFHTRDVWTLFHSAAFDFSVWEIWGALLYGGRLVIVPFEVSRTPDAFHDLLVRERVTVLNQTPSAFKQLMAVDATRDPQALSLRTVVFGGEALQLESLEPWFARHGDQTPRLVNMYGITETTVHVTYRPIRAGESGSRIGVPIPDLQLHLLDPYRQPVPDGATGELYVAGPGVARGYLNQPALTSQRMIANPFGAGRLYKTGDLARRRGDEFEFLGRADEQVKIRGFRIELGEIEAVLAAHPLVRECVVVMKDDRLVAYAVLRDVVTSETLRTFLAERLPDYMLPSAFVILDALPLTSNGKIHRALLPAPEAASADSYAGPRSEAERALCDVWSEVLGVPRVGIHDNFFALGGDSIRSIQVLSKARARGFDYSFGELFGNPTIAALAAGGGMGEEAPTQPFALVSDDVRVQLRSDVDDAYPLTKLQQGMFFHSELEPGATAYHDVMSYHVRAPFEPAALRDALGFVAARHAILRTSVDFASFAEPLQLVHRHAVIPFAHTLGASDLHAWIERERRTPFDAATAPLLRAHVHDAADGTFHFTLSFHHAILDGWSVASLLTELFRDYLRRLGHDLDVPPPPALSFRDYVALERAAGDAEFWASYLADAPFASLPRLQTLVGGQAPPPVRVRKQPVRINADTASALKTLADTAGVPLRSTLLAAHLRALAHITNERDVVTGLVTNGRPEREGGERVFGLFLNTVPLRVDIRSGSWRELVTRTFRAEGEVSAHRRYPLADIQRACGGRPLFETDFNFVHFHVFDQLRGIAGIEALGGEGVEETNFPLAVNFSQAGGGIGATLDYDASLITEEQARDYAECYEEVLRRMAATPDDAVDARPLSDADVLAGDAHDIEPFVIPDSPFEARANQLAHALRRNGVGPDVLVGVLLEPGDDRVTALLAVLKAGGAYLPLEPSYPQSRLELMTSEARLNHLITVRGAVLTATHTLFIDDDHAYESTAAPDVAVSPDNLAYSLFTSGSTGVPKGALITRRNLANHMQWMARAYPLTPADRVLQKTPFSFDASVWEFWAPLLAGAALVSIRPGGHGDPAYLVETIRVQGITILQVVPTLLDALLNEPRFAECRTLRRVFAGGEALAPDLARRVRAALPDVELVNLYGPTEATIDATSARVEGDAVTIGRPIDNLRALVLDDQLHPVPVGTDGDLYLGGAGLARGYLGRAALTAERFVPDPFGSGERLYRSGDRARILPDGTLDFRGRADGQVKLRGHRVELGEIEAAIAAHPHAPRAVVGVRDNRLVAWLAGPAPADLRAHLAARLPEAMVPALFVAVDALPLTPSGKIDRKALPSPDATAAVRREFVPPSTDAERAIAAAWESVLGVARVGMDDNFFELGGDSILSLQIVSRVRAAGWTITPKLMLQQQTVARVAAHAVRSASAPRVRERASGTVPLTPIQHAFFEQPLVNRNHWNQSLLLTVPPSFDFDAFRRRLDEVTQHHDAFRLRFAAKEDALPVQFYADEPGVVAERIETDDITATAARVQASLDIEHGPLMRAAHLDRGAGRDGRLLLVIHHLIVDGVSWRILFDDLQRTGATPPATALLREWSDELQSRACVADPHYWLDLASVAAPPLPLDARDEANLEADARLFATQLDEAETGALLQELPRQTHAGVTELLLAALTETVTAWTGADALWLDLEGHGRESDDVDLSRTVGWFTALFPLQLTRPDGRGSIALLKSVKSQLRAVPAKGLDFGVLRYLSPDDGIRTSLAALPPRPISFNYLGRFADAHDAAYAPAPEFAGPDHDPASPRPYLIDVIARVAGGRLSIEWSYAGRAFREHTIERLAASLLDNLRRLIADARALHDGAWIPSDFPLARLDQPALDALLAGRGEVDDLLPLSPLQEGLLFHAMDDEAGGVYLQQIAARLHGAPDPAAFERAWNRTIARHAILRTSFHRQGDLGRPLQLVHAAAACPVTWSDWRALSDDERAERWQSLLAEDRATLLDPEKAPLMRVHVVRERDAGWRLLWTHHHLILDGWSLPLVLRDVVAFYRQESEGVDATLPLPPSYRDLIEWLEARDPAQAAAYWRDALADFTHPNEIALPRPAAADEKPFDDVELVVAEDVTDALTALAQREHVTLNTVLQTLWARLVAAYSRQRDVVFGVTVSGRPAELPGIENAVGLFINTLPLRVPVDHAAPLDVLLQDVQRRQLALSQFESSRLVDVQAASGVPRGQSLFDTILVFENYPLGDSLAATPLRDFTAGEVTSVEWTHYGLTCYVTPGRELRLKLVYRTDRFARGAMEGMLAEAQKQLLMMLGRPLPRPVHDAAREEHDLAPFHHRFAAQAARTPDAVAVVCESRTLTYAQLDAQSNALAADLRARGLGREQLAGIYLERSPEMLVALLAVLKAGGAYLPLDPRFPAARLAAMIDDGAPKVLITQPSLAESLPPHGAQVVVLDAAVIPSAARDLGRDDRNLRSLAPLGMTEEGRAAERSNDLAYVIFTSGSTGRPKGVQIPHRALTNLLQTFARRPGLGADDVLVAVTTLSFDIAALELFLPLMTGARLVVATAEEAADGERLSALLANEKATVMQATPATWRLLLTTGWTPPPGLRMWCGGEAMPPDLADALLVNGNELWNVYGPTETTIWSAIHPVRTAADSRSLGCAVGNTTLRVVDEHMQPLPDGVPGELLIGGDGVARGYRGAAALTAERFVPDPFALTRGARAYRTGDLVRRRDDGMFEFLGRIDAQVKIRGFRVELGEIEAALRLDPDVSEAVVAVHDDRNGLPRLVAYLVLAGQRRANLGADLAAALRTRLPEYMVPGIYIDLDALPLTPNGKIDRRALPPPDLDAAAGRENAFVAPRTPLEEVLADAWKQTLGLDRVGVHDHFFALGGHSLHAAQIVAWLRRAFQLKVPLRSLFEAATVEQLAGVITRLDTDGRAAQRAAALLKIKAMTPEERARRRDARTARDAQVPT